FPTFNPIQPSRGGGTDGFVSALNVDGSALLFSTWLGGSASEYLYGVAVDATGNISVVGETTSSNFPTAAPMQLPGGGLDAVVLELADAGTSFVYSTFLGGALEDSARGVAVDNAGNVFVAGRTTSTDFPVAAPLQRTNAGMMDGFVAKIGNSTALSLSGIDP